MDDKDSIYQIIYLKGWLLYKMFCRKLSLLWTTSTTRLYLTFPATLITFNHIFKNDRIFALAQARICSMIWQLQTIFQSVWFIQLFREKKNIQIHACSIASCMMIWSYTFSSISEMKHTKPPTTLLIIISVTGYSNNISLFLSKWLV